MADEINHERLSALKTRSYNFEGIIDGDFDEKLLPTKNALSLKFGAQVMLLNNDSNGRWINGSIGKVVSVKSREDQLDIIHVELENREVVEVTPFTWEVYKFFYNEDAEKLESESIGAFTQYPLRLAWAITIHKSQGKTFHKVILDVGYGTFAHGQMYVALSRCTDLEGIVLRTPIIKRHIILDKRVVDFLSICR
jgi:ATP-dependent exoDNAse (exonuclease V) alpha subunit